MITMPHKRDSRLVLWLFAMPGYAPTAVMMQPAGRLHRGVTREDVLLERLDLAQRILGPAAKPDEVLSELWKADVFCTAEFSRWWRTRPAPPPDEHRIFLRILKA